MTLPELYTEQLEYNELQRHVFNVQNGINDTFCGWGYYESEFKEIFAGGREKENYVIDEKVECGDTGVFILEISDDKRDFFRTLR